MLMKISKEESGLSVWELTEKCICCTESTLALNILTIANSNAPEYSSLNLTGVGYLSIIKQHSQIEYELQIEMLAPTLAGRRKYR